MAALLVELVELVTAERAEKKAAAHEFDQDLLVAELAASLITPEHLGDEEHVVLAVHTARLVLRHARRDVHTVPVAAAGKPS